MSPFPWSKPNGAPRPATAPTPRSPGKPPKPRKPQPPARPTKGIAAALAMVVLGLALIVAALTAPAAPASEPVSVRVRSATEQERRDYDARQLAEFLEENARQREGATSAATAVTPESRTRTNPDEEGRSR